MVETISVLDSLHFLFSGRTAYSLFQSTMMLSVMKVGQLSSTNVTLLAFYLEKQTYRKKSEVVRSALPVGWRSGWRLLRREILNRLLGIPSSISCLVVRSDIQRKMGNHPAHFARRAISLGQISRLNGGKLLRKMLPAGSSLTPDLEIAVVSMPKKIKGRTDKYYLLLPQSAAEEEEIRSSCSSVAKTYALTDASSYVYTEYRGFEID